MTQKLTEEQQRSAHKIIVANRGDCGTSSNPILKCLKCPNSFTNSGSNCFGCKIELDDFQLNLAFQAENLRRSQAWLDEHITDAEIMAESPREFCERMVRTKGFGRCKGRSFFSDADSCKNCVLFTNKGCSENLTFSRAKAYLDYVEPEKVVNPEPFANAPKPEAKEKVNTTVKGDVDKLPLGLLHLINFRDLLPTDALRIIALEGQVDDLTKKLTASTRKCERLQRRLRAKWEAKRDGEMATREEIEVWLDSGKGVAIINGSSNWIGPNGRTDWIPATRGNLKL